MKIRLGHGIDELRPSLTNGPGWRISFWVQGCSICCTDSCLNPKFQSSVGGYLCDVEDFIQALEDIKRNSYYQIEGITALGGEPTDQSEAVGLIFKGAKELDLSTMLYSGHTIENLKLISNNAIQLLLDYTDILVDGPFEGKLYDGSLAWRGSENQRIYCLSNRYDDKAVKNAFREQGKGFSIVINRTGKTSVSGLQSKL